jgi:UDP-N-acetylmuramoyl-tripeptide--D-alanyl-D-alanine ligase
MEVALENLDQLSDSLKIAILGDMFEIGKDSMAEHQHIAELVSDLDIDKVFLIGQNFSSVNINNNKIKQFRNFNSFKEFISQNPIEKSTVLIKASRGMRLERLVDLL